MGWYQRRVHGTTFFNSSERKSSTTHQNAITASKSEFWYGTPISLKEEPRHSITTENIHKKVRPKSALISASAAEVQNKGLNTIYVGLIPMQIKFQSPTMQKQH